MKILLIDDDPLLGQILAKGLKKQHEVKLLVSAREALMLLQDPSAAEVFDLIISDLMMPEVTGMQLYHELSQSHPHLAKHFLFMSGGAFTEQAKEFVKTLGKDRVIDKPFNLRDLSDFITRYSSSL